MGISKGRCDLSSLFLEQVSGLKPEFVIKSTEIITHIEPNINAVRDVVRMQQVITNLLMNSLKFGETKTVEISAIKQNGSVVITIKDHGIGISPLDLERIFKPFERALSDKHFGGMELCIFINLQIMKAHNGKIDVESELGKGTTFTVELPLL